MKIRKSICAGSWYPQDKDTLQKTIDNYLKKAQKNNAKVKALIVPHAGINYSGPVAAQSFKQLDSDLKKIIILGTSHHYPLKGASLLQVDAYETPLGLIPVDKIEDDMIQAIPEAHAKEHSIEIELPFLQRVLNNFSIIPIIVGQIDIQKFANFLEKQDLPIIVSVDLSHFHEYNQAVRLDNQTIQAILNLQTEKITNCEIDSKFAISAIMELAQRKKWQTKLLDYKNSGDISGEKSSVVGYAAIAFYEEEIKKNQDEYLAEEKKMILNLAKNAVENFVKFNKTITSSNKSNKLKEKRACFVTLTQNGDLRGCIGTIEPQGPLDQSIIQNAISACSQDPRFSPITPEELPEIEYEVSILTLPQKISFNNNKELFSQIKNKGVILQKNFYQATYLPQVWEHFSREEDFLSSLCEKAGLGRDEWQKEIEVSVYEAFCVS